MPVTKKDKIDTARKNAEAMKAARKQARTSKSSTGDMVNAAKGSGKKPASLIKQVAKKKK